MYFWLKWLGIWKSWIIHYEFFKKWAIPGLEVMRNVLCSRGCNEFESWHRIVFNTYQEVADIKHKILLICWFMTCWVIIRPICSKRSHAAFHGIEGYGPNWTYRYLLWNCFVVLEMLLWVDFFDDFKKNFTSFCSPLYLSTFSYLTKIFFSNWPLPAYFFLIFVFSTVNSNMFMIKLYQRFDSNQGPLIPETTTLPTVPQPPPYVNILIRFRFIKSPNM